jgi:hypothetical protein
LASPFGCGCAPLDLPDMAVEGVLGGGVLGVGWCRRESETIMHKRRDHNAVLFCTGDVVQRKRNAWSCRVGEVLYCVRDTDRHLSRSPEV